MLFRAQKIKEDKLSEKISDDNPYKQKLIDMEKPVTSTPIYSFIVISLLVYIWCFLSAMIYFQAPYLKLSIFVVVFSTVCIFFSYKKNFLSSNKHNLINYIFLIMFSIISIYIGISDVGTYSNKQIIYSFLFIFEVNNKSYIALSILSFLAFGVSKTYPVPYYEIYRRFYDHYRNDSTNLNRSINKIKLLFVLGIVFVPLAFQNAFNIYTDSYNRSIKCFSVLYFAAFPELVYFGHALTKYYGTYKKAKKVNKISK